MPFYYMLFRQYTYDIVIKGIGMVNDVIKFAWFIVLRLF